MVSLINMYFLAIYFAAKFQHCIVTNENKILNSKVNRFFKTKDACNFINLKLVKFSNFFSYVLPCKS